MSADASVLQIKCETLAQAAKREAKKAGMPARSGSADAPSFPPTGEHKGACVSAGPREKLYPRPRQPTPLGH